MDVAPRRPFDPLGQNVTFYAADGATPIGVPLAAVDAFNDESVSICINYGAQMGACLVMLLAVLIMTPAAKLRRPSGLLHGLGLALCIVRTALLAAYFLSPLNHFYPSWAHDYSAVPPAVFRSSIAANVLSLVLVGVVEAALMNQAWTMVALWPDAARFSLAAASAVVTLLTVGFRLAFTVIQNRAVLSLVPPVADAWLIHAALVTNALSICWFCALFNTKLVVHLVSNRGILPSTKTLNSMEVLVMTNGILMIVPVIFAGLEWGHFRNFEAGSLTLTSVAIILPLGTLAAQQMTTRASTAASRFAYQANSHASAAACAARCPTNAGSVSSATPPLKLPSLTTSCGSSATRHGSSLSKCDRGMAPAPPRDRVVVTDHFDLELRQIDSTSALTPAAAAAAGHIIRVDRGLERQDERI